MSRVGNTEARCKEDCISRPDCNFVGYHNRYCHQFKTCDGTNSNAYASGRWKMWEKMLPAVDADQICPNDAALAAYSCAVKNGYLQDFDCPETLGTTSTLTLTTTTTDTATTTTTTTVTATTATSSTSTTQTTTTATTTTTLGMPKVVRIVPDSGTVFGGTTVTAYGANFNKRKNYSCAFGVGVAIATVVSSSSIQCKTPRALDEANDAGAVQFQILESGAPVSAGVEAGLLYKYVPDCSTVACANGVCTNGQCTCFQGWADSGCATKLYPPVFTNHTTLDLLEGVHFSKSQWLVASGTQPISWKIVKSNDAPAGLTISRHGDIEWPSPTVSVHKVVVQGRNLVGHTNVELSINVARGYDVEVEISEIDGNAVPQGGVGLHRVATGGVIKVEGKAIPLHPSVSTSRVPVHLWLQQKNGKVVELRKINTYQSGLFQHYFQLTPSQAGRHVGTYFCLCPLSSAATVTVLLFLPWRYRHAVCSMKHR